MTIRLRYKKSERFVLTTIVCDRCHKRDGFTWVWCMTKIEGRLQLKRSHIYICQTCAPTKAKFVAYFINKARRDAMAADMLVYEARKKSIKSLKKHMRVAQSEKPRNKGAKCVCGSGKKYKNCCHKKLRIVR